MGIETLNEKFKDQLTELDGLTAEAKDLQIALMLRNITMVMLSPVIGNKAVLDTYFEILTTDLSNLGYTLTKNENTADSTSDTNEEEEA